MVERGRLTAQTVTLDSFVRAFEKSHESGEPAELHEHLPPPGNPLARQVLCELVRVDMEYRWSQGEPRRLGWYLEQYPELAEDQSALRDVAFEEYRQRWQAGERPDQAEYLEVFGVDVGQSQGWLCPVTDGSAGLPAEAHQASFPDPGETVFGFRLVGELGRGTFSRVYLARQVVLADRPVALKLTRAELGEPVVLARLQHTNIVPIFSVHRLPGLHGICMPYLGATTLADLLRAAREATVWPPSGEWLAAWVRERRGVIQRGTHAVTGLDTVASRGYVEAVLWIGSRLAAGLSHAHARGVLHLDLKPANVLLADDGQPMLLDFNLARDRQGLADGQPVGGTLAYMAPEQRATPLNAGLLGEGSDLYSLGVVLHELLAGERPVEGSSGSRLRKLRESNDQVTPAVGAILGRLLEADPGKRYRRAADVQEDLERQLADRPLRHAVEPSVRERWRKWLRRNPRLASASGIGVAGAVVVAALVAALAAQMRHSAVLEAGRQLSEFRQDLLSAQFDLHAWGDDARRRAEGVASCRRALGRFGAAGDGQWWLLGPSSLLPAPEQAALRSDVAELQWLLASADARQASGSVADRATRLESALVWNQRAEVSFGTSRVPRALLSQRAELNAELGRPAEALRLAALAEATPMRTARDRYLMASGLLDRGEAAEALPLLEDACGMEPRNYWAWFVRGRCLEAMGRDLEAGGSFSVCIALEPGHASAWFNRGLVRLRQRDASGAEADFTAAIQRGPGRHEAFVDRGLARMAQGDHARAIEDFTLALRLGAPATRVYLMRSRAREAAGDRPGSAADRRRGLESTPEDEAGWVARGLARLAEEPAGALSDFDRALELEPTSYPALMNRAHVLSERLGRAEEAVATLLLARETHPGQASIRSARGVLLARLGRREEAIAEGRSALDLDGSPATAYQVASLFARCSSVEPVDADESLRLLGVALRAGYGLDKLADDSDFEPIRRHPEFRRLVTAARTIGQVRPLARP